MPWRFRSILPRGLTRGVARGVVFTVAVLAAVEPGCGSQNQNAPPADILYFPSGLALDPGGGYLYVTNGNADLRYSGGVVNVLDVGKIDGTLAAYGGGTIPSGCARSVFSSSELDCDATSYFVPNAAVQVGNFAGEVRVEELTGAPNGAARRLFLPVRGDPSLTYVDVLMSGGAVTGLVCTQPAPVNPAFLRCDGSHRLSQLANGDALPDEPFGIYLDQALGNLYLAHQVGFVTLVSVPANGQPPVLLDTRAGLVGIDSSGREQAFGIAARTPGDPSGLVYVTSRSTSTFGLFTVAGGHILPVQQAVPLDVLRLGNDVRGLAFLDGGNELLMLDRQPSSLLVLDTSLGRGGLPKNQVEQEIGVCANPSIVATFRTPSRTHAYVVCFSANAVWDVDVDAATVLAEIPVGAGPNGIAFSTSPPRAYVADFSESSVSVIDLDESSPTFDQTILKLGPRPPGAA